MRIGVIASIAHRLPPTGYGPWEQIASTLTEGFVARGHEVTLFATANSATTATLHGTAPAGYEEVDGVDAKVCEALHIGRRLRAGRRIRRHGQPFRFHAAELQPTGADADGDHDPRLLLGADRAGLPGVRRHRALRGDQ